MHVRTLKFALTICFCTSFLLCCEKESTGKKIPQDATEPPPNWYTSDTITEGNYKIEELRSKQGNVSYLLTGSDRAILFDTGSGENGTYKGTKMRYLTNELTDQPLTLLLSHFHFDHNQNVGEFENIAFADLDFLRDKVTAQNKYTFTEEDLFLGNYPGEIEVSEWLPLETDIDLGDRSIQIVSIPGHTKESVAIIDAQNEMVFLGDFLYNGALFLFDDADVPVYLNSTNLLLDKLHSGYRLFGAHGEPEVAFWKLQKLAEFLNCIIAENCTPQATKVWGFPANRYQYEGLSILVFQ